jgi:enduracididine beta-hydroxylase
MKISMTARETHDIQALIDEITVAFHSIEDPELLRRLPLLAHELPRRLRALLLEFKLDEPAAGVLVFSGFPIDEDRIGPTPAHWDARTCPPSTLREEVFCALLASLLGEPIAWATQQGGHVVHDVLPIRGHEGEQLGSGSEQLLWWHTEDAFHSYRGDYIQMFCLRNPDRVPTTVGTLEGIRLEQRHLELLFEPLFTILPDESHLPKNRPPNPGAAERSASYERIQELQARPPKLPVLFGDPSSPYLRLDPYFMERVEDPPEAQEALDALVQFIDAGLWDLVLEPGDVCFIDNYRAVHGRKPFKARYDGRDRWLKRLNIARDLRKSRSARESSTSRVIG